jgi:hypothetical protein
MDQQNNQRCNLPVTGSNKNGNLLDSCNYLDDNRDSHQLGIREEVIMKTIFLILILLMPLTAIADESFRDKYGHPSGGSSTNGNITDYRNKYGDPSGSVTNEGNGQYTIRDQNGDIVGEVDRDE